MQWVGIIPELGEVLTYHHHMFNKTDTSCCQIKMGMVAYLRASSRPWRLKNCLDSRPKGLGSGGETRVDLYQVFERFFQEMMEMNFFQKETATFSKKKRPSQIIQKHDESKTPRFGIVDKNTAIKNIRLKNVRSFLPFGELNSCELGVFRF